MSDNCKVPQVKPIVIKRFGTSGLIPTIPTTTDCNLWQKTDLKDGEFAINTQDNKLYLRSGNQILELTNQSSGGGSGSVTSVGLSMPSAFSVANSPITGSGTLVVTATGTTGEYIRGDGSLATFPTIPSFTPSALTKTDDTNVTLTLGGTPNTALLEATSLTLGWSGELAVSRGGTGAGSFTANNLLLGNGTSSFQTVAPGTSGNVLTSNGTTWVSQAPTGGGITIGTTAIASGTVGRVLFEGAGNVVQQSSNFFWNNTDGRLGIRTATPTASLEVLGAAASGTGQAFAVHNQSGNNNALIVNNEGFVGVGTAAPFNTGAWLSVGSSSVNGIDLASTVIRLRTDFNGSPAFNLINNTDGNASGTGIFMQNGTGRNMYIYSFHNGYTQATFGGQGNATVIYGKYTANVTARMKFALSNNTAESQNEFQWISAVQASTSTGQGFGTTAPIMTLKGNGALLIGTVTDVASSILTLASTTKGFLPPRNADPATNITSPAEGLIAFDTTDKKLQVYDGTNWIDLH
jgi:hypothetical protein